MSIAPSRLVLRHQRFVTRKTASFRSASTTSEAANATASTATKAKESTSELTSKASQGLTRVTSSGGAALKSAGDIAGNTLNKIGGRTGRLISFVQSLVPPTIYYSKVGLELSKIVFRGQKMSPPDLAHFQSHAQPLMRALRNPRNLFVQSTETASSTSPESILNRIRNMSRADMATVGVVGAEVLGFFTVGEMIGRLKLVGYRGDTEHHEHATPH